MPQPKPTAFVLYGATGDLAKRMVLPAFYRLWQEGLLPAKWKLIGNGRGDVDHLDFRNYLRAMLTEFGAKPDPKTWSQFAEHVYFAGGGFNTDDPGSLLDVLKHARGQLGRNAQLIHYFAVPPGAFEELTRAIGQHGLAAGRAGRVREAVRDVRGEVPHARPGRALGAGRAAGLPHRPLPR